MQQHIRLCFFLFPCLRAVVSQDMVFPMLVLGVVFVIPSDMVDQGAVAVTKILPSLVVVAFTLECEVNAELGLIVPASFIARPFTLHALFFVQRLEQRVSTGKGHLFAVV